MSFTGERTRTPLGSVTSSAAVACHDVTAPSDVRDAVAIAAVSRAHSTRLVVLSPEIASVLLLVVKAPP